MTACDDIRDALKAFEGCTETPDGFRVKTHCVYPSFDPVHVFVTRFGIGYRVHDGGGAVREAWAHGRDERAYKKIMERNALRFGVPFVTNAYTVTVQSAGWLGSALIAVANTSSAAAIETIEHISTATEIALEQRIFDVLTELVPPSSLGREIAIRGKSGKSYNFDFVIRKDERTTLIDAVSPHHVSIASKFVAFSDAPAAIDRSMTKYAVFDRELEPSDSALLQQVADLVPFAALRPLMSRMPHNGR
ncbi:MAG TPA: DUF1829 domain-containing protein [Rhizomicrobium sp.]